MGFYKNTFPVPQLLHKALSFLGKASYSIYLLHPIVYSVINAVFLLVTKRYVTIPMLLTVCISIAVTLIASSIVYKYYESFFVRLGNML